MIENSVIVAVTIMFLVACTNSIENRHDLQRERDDCIPKWSTENIVFDNNQQLVFEKYPAYRSVTEKELDELIVFIDQEEAFDCHLLGSIIQTDSLRVDIFHVSGAFDSYSVLRTSNPQTGKQKTIRLQEDKCDLVGQNDTYEEVWCTKIISQLDGSFLYQSKMVSYTKYYDSDSVVIKDSINIVYDLFDDLEKNRCYYDSVRLFTN